MYKKMKHKGIQADRNKRQQIGPIYLNCLILLYWIHSELLG